MIRLGQAGVLSPGRLQWLRALGWMVLLVVATTLLLFPGWLGLGLDRLWIRGLGVMLAYAGYAALVRWGEREWPREIDPRPLLPELAIGLLIGAGMFTAVFGALRLLGVYGLGAGQWTDWPRDVAGALATGFAEELTARAVIFRLLVRAAGRWPALVGSALLFGFAHLSNPNGSMLAALAIAVEAGLMLAAFYLLTGRIWMSVGAHAAWNFTQGPVFGASVSGQVEQGSLFVSAPLPGAPEALTGGAFGPEASLPAVLVGGAVFTVAMLSAGRRERRRDVSPS
jgi:uncharacterized protein